MNSNTMEYLGHAAYTIGIMSFMLKDMLWLRVTTIVAASMVVFYNYAAPIEPMWVPIYWNTALVLINIIQVAILVYERREIQFSEKEKWIYSNVFPNFAAIDFKKLIEAASWKTSEKGETLIFEGQVNGDLMLITEGKCEVRLPQGAVAELSNGDFIGEMSFLSGKASSATVSAAQKVDYIIWDRAKLNKLFTKSPTLQTSIKSAMSNQLTDKIVRTSKLVSE